MSGGGEEGGIFQFCEKMQKSLLKINKMREK